MKKIILCTLFFIISLGFVPTSAANVPSEYQSYIDTINGDGARQFFWKYVTTTSSNYVINDPFSNHSWFDCPYGDTFYQLSFDSATYCSSFVSCSPDILRLDITSNGDNFIGTISNISNFAFMSRSGSPRYLSQITCPSLNSTTCTLNGNTGSYFSGTTCSYQGSLASVFSYFSSRFRNLDIYVDGNRWASALGNSYSIETEIELPCDIQAVDSTFNFFNGGYGVTWKQGEYNWTQTGPLENVTRTMVWTVSYPTVSYVQSLYNQSFVDSTPLDVVRNAFNTVFNSGTSIYDIPEQYRATTNFFINIDSPELGSSYHTSYDSTTQQWALTQNEYSYSLVNGYQFNTGFFQQLYQLYGDADLFSIALCYITPVRVSMYAVDDTQGIIYNPLSIYWLDLKQSNGTVLEYRNFGSQTTVSDDNVTDDTTSNDSVTGDDSPFVNPTEEQLNTNYNNSIQNSYNHTVNNYYNYNDINTDLLDYYLSFRDGGTEEDVQEAFGYLNATISSLSNVPVVLHNLFYNFFPLPVIRLMQALFIVFMVFMIIIIIKHLFR